LVPFSPQHFTPHRQRIPSPPQPRLSRSPTKQTEPQWRPSRLPGFPRMHTKMESKHTHPVCLSRGRRTQDMQQPEMQIHCRMRVAGRCPCNARHARHAAGLHTSMLPRPGLRAWSVCSSFCCLWGVSLWPPCFPARPCPQGLHQHGSQRHHTSRN
jgi:hypothetical protein